MTRRAKPPRPAKQRRRTSERRPADGAHGATGLRGLRGARDARPGPARLFGNGDKRRRLCVLRAIPAF
jgi:hypothetical protein